MFVMRYEHKNGLSLTKIERSDLPDLKELKNESWFGTHTVAIVNMDDQNRWFDKAASLVLKAELVNSTQESTVGYFKIDNLCHSNRVAHVGWDIRKYWRGRGYGKKLVELGVDFCFEVLNLNRLDAEILQNNVASQHCATAAGFEQEGCRRAAVHQCNTYIDSFIYGLLREDWNKTWTAPRNLSYVPKEQK